MRTLFLYVAIIGIIISLIGSAWTAGAGAHHWGDTAGIFLAVGAVAFFFLDVD